MISLTFSGDILVFLTGQDEIEEACEKLNERFDLVNPLIRISLLDSFQPMRVFVKFHDFSLALRLMQRTLRLVEFKNFWQTGYQNKDYINLQIKRKGYKSSFDLDIHSSL